jgi:transcriptional regulator with GAF, ATPase, and Fis domain
MTTEHTAATQIIRAPDGAEHLVLRRAQLTVVEGPNKGLQHLLDKPRIRIGAGRDCEVKLDDPAVSRYHLELTAGPDGFELKDLGSTNGTFVSGVRMHQVTLLRGTRIRLGSTAIDIAPSEETISLELSARGTFGRLLGESAAMRQIFATLEKVARTDATVVIEGESGTGKELVAEALHDESARRDEAFSVVDCGAIPANLMESELFGHERGAFTGAERQRIGAIETAHNGTVFFDEIGELPLELQPRLLRFLESHEIKPVGASTHKAVNVRVIAATNRDLANEVEKGRFREDLFYRLSVVRVELPPLRQRRDDILLLAMHFAERFARDPRSVITDEMATLLRSHEWPGNVRELRNVVERLAVVPQHGLADLRERAGGNHPDASLAAPTPGASEANEEQAGAQNPLQEYLDLPFHEARNRWQERFERAYLQEQLERSGGVVARAARQSELPRQSFHRLLKRHGLRGE